MALTATMMRTNIDLHSWLDDEAEAADVHELSH